MLKEYISNIKNENDNKLASLEREMQELVNDLNCTEKILEKLQREKKLDTNIFSPRTIDMHSSEKIENTQSKVNEIKRKIEYVSLMIEDALKQKNELNQIAEEAENYTSVNPVILDVNENKESENKTENQRTEKNKIPSESVPCEKILTAQKSLSGNQLSSTIENSNTVEKIKIDNPDTLRQSSDEELISFLKLIYQKTETSLALINGNKNRCKAELRSTLSLIKEYAKKVENTSE